MTGQSARVEVRILGPLEVRVDDAVVPVTAAKQRTLVALLAVHAGEAVPVERIVDELWGEPPASVVQSVQMHVSRVRRALGEADGAVVETTPAGYRLAAGVTTDAHRFETLVAEAEAGRRTGDRDAAREQLAAALALWRAEEALTGVERGPILAGEAARLDARHLAARLDRIEIDLELGRHDAVVGELEALARRHPLQERIRALLMTALYRSGRQAEALDVYADTRRRLVDELGLEPTQRLQDLQRAILRQAPALEAPAPQAPARPEPPAPARTPPPIALPQRWLVRIGLGLVAAAVVGLLVVGWPFGERGLERIDADAVGVVETGSGSIVAQVTTGGRPVAMAATRDAVWVADAERDQLVRIEPTDVRSVDTVPIGSGTSAVAAGEGAVWAVASNTRTLARVDVGTNTVVRRIRVGNGARAAAAGGGSVWVANALDGTVSQIRASAGREVRRVPVGALPSGVAVGSGAVWVANETDGTVTRVDPARGVPVATIRVGNGPAGITAGAEGVWVANAADGTLSRIDPRNDVVTATVPVGERPAAVALADGAVWVAASDGLRRVDPRRAEVTHTYRVGASPAALASTADRLWIAAQPAESSHRGGTLVFAGTTDRNALDPALAELGDRSFAMLAVVADGLVGHRRAGGAAGAALVPDLARALPDPAGGGLTYRFRLRPRLRYSSGAPVRARDVRASIERLHEMGAEALGVYPLGLRGEEACDAGGCDLSSGIETDDATGTVTFHLREPNPDFLLNLGVPLYAVLPAGSPARDLTGPDLVGTGPYRVVAASAEEVTLERNPRFRVWSADAQPAGFPDRIVWRLSDDAGADVRMDAAAAEIDRLAVTAPARVRRNPISFLLYAWLNTDVPPFSSEDARRAVAMAVDRRALRPRRSPTPGLLARRPTCQLLSPGFPGYDPSCTIGPPDIRRARLLVRRSGTAGMRVRFWVARDDTFWSGFGRQFVRTLRRIGYRAVLEDRFDPFGFIEATLDPGTGAQAGGGAWFGDKPSASNVIPPLLGCPSETRAGFNQAQFCARELDARMRRAHTLEATDPAGANALWARLDRELLERSPIVPILSGETVQVTSERLGNYQYHLRYGPLLAQAWVR